MLVMLLISFTHIYSGHVTSLQYRKTEVIIVIYYTCRCLYLAQTHSMSAHIIYDGILFFFVIANFTVATVIDPGRYPRGAYYEFYIAI